MTDEYLTFADITPSDETDDEADPRDEEYALKIEGLLPRLEARMTRVFLADAMGREIRRCQPSTDVYRDGKLIATLAPGVNFYSQELL